MLIKNLKKKHDYTELITTFLSLFFSYGTIYSISQKV